MDPNLASALTDFWHRTNGIRQSTSQTQRINLAEDAEVRNRNTTLKK
jgi:hypothetical protein